MKTNEKSKLWKWQKECESGGQCEKCKRIVGYLTVDHIIPVSFLLCLDDGKNLANNDEDNFQKLCQPCNKMKGASWDLTNEKAIRLLDKYLSPYGFIINP